jgi:hypothetical protein
MGTFSEEHGGERVPGQRPRPLPHTNLMNKARNPKSGTHPSIVRGEHGTSTLVSSGGIPRDWSSRAGTVPRARHRRRHPPSPRGRRHRRRRPRRSSPAGTSSSPAPPPHGRDFIHAGEGEELVTRAPWQQGRGGGTRGLREGGGAGVGNREGFRKRRRRTERNATQSLLSRVSAETESGGPGPSGSHRLPSLSVASCDAF